MPILKTRLIKPAIRHYYVTRENILGYLELQSESPLILVVGAAGYGKSITISQWLTKRRCNYGWISLDSDCNDLRTFLEYLVGSIQINYPGKFSELHSICDATVLPGERIISDLFLNEITTFDEKFVVVLDDYHFINNDQIHRVLNQILKYPSEYLQIIVISRKDPPLDLSVLKAYGEVGEVRMSNLKFDEKEAIELADNISTKGFSHDEVAQLVSATEGWIVGLKLGIHSISQGSDLRHVLSNLAHEKHSISQFLMDEILYPQEKTIRDCFYKASILSHFCKSLLFEICASDEIGDKNLVPDSKCFLSEISANSLFVVPLDTDQVWFRFHHLFGEILLKQLEKRFTPEEISGLHAKASRWFAANGYFDEALKHALKAGDIQFAIWVIEKQLPDLLDNENVSLLHQWLSQIPGEVSNSHFSLNLIRAFVCEAKHDQAGMEKALNRAFTLLPRSSRDRQETIYRGYFFSMQAMFFYMGGKLRECLSASAKALEILEEECGYMKDIALVYQAFALVAMGKRSEAEKKLNDYRELIEPADKMGSARNNIAASMISFLNGDLPRIHNLLFPLVEFYKGKALRITKGILNNYLGFVYYQWNQLEESSSLLNDSWAHRFPGRPFWMLQSLFLKVSIHYTRGEYAKLNQLFEEAHRFVNDISLPELRHLISTMQIEFALRDHSLDHARELFQRTGPYKMKPIWYYFIPQLTRIKFLIFEGREENLEDADLELNELIDFGRSTNNVNVLVQSLATMAILRNRQVKKQEALTCLSEALNHARPGGLIRVFVDMGIEMRDLIIQHNTRTIDDPFVNKILEVFALEKTKPRRASHQEKTQNRSAATPSTITSNGTEILSQQEIRLLKLISEGYQNKQIAAKMFLAPNSVKKYLYDLYQKLGVNNRTRAINTAKEQNII